MTMRRAFLRLVPVLGLLLLAGWLGVAFHHHPEAESGRSCLICVAGQTQGTVASDTPATPLLTIAARISLAVEPEPSAPYALALGARAPPAC